MKTLVILAHPNIEKSKVNSVLKKHLENEKNVTVHEIYKEFKGNKFNIESERKLVEEHDRIVFQFPFQMFSAPSLLKEWQDEVLEFSFLKGPGGEKLKGKEFLLAITAGGTYETYQAGGALNFTISELTKPYQAMANFINMKFLKSFVVYNTHALSEEEIIDNAEKLASLIRN